MQTIVFYFRIRIKTIRERKQQCCGAGAGGAEIILRPGAGAEIIFVIIIFCSPFGEFK